MAINLFTVSCHHTTTLDSKVKEQMDDDVTNSESNSE